MSPTRKEIAAWPTLHTERSQIHGFTGVGCCIASIKTAKTILELSSHGATQCDCISLIEQDKTETVGVVVAVALMAQTVVDHRAKDSLTVTLSRVLRALS